MPEILKRVIVSEYVCSGCRWEGWLSDDEFREADREHGHNLVHTGNEKFAMRPLSVSTTAGFPMDNQCRGHDGGDSND
jgi:hypothetical protein